MTDVSHNLAEIATEFRELPSSIADLLHSIEDFVQKIDHGFSSVQLSNKESFMRAYNEVRKNTRSLKKSQKSYLSILTRSENHQSQMILTASIEPFILS